MTVTTMRSPSTPSMICFFAPLRKRFRVYRKQTQPKNRNRVVFIIVNLPPQEAVHILVQSISGELQHLRPFLLDEGKIEKRIDNLSG